MKDANGYSTFTSTNIDAPVSAGSSLGGGATAGAVLPLAPLHNYADLLLNDLACLGCDSDCTQ